MPTIYQARCDDCTFTSPVFPEGYGAVWVEDPGRLERRSAIAGMVLTEAVDDLRIAEEADPRLVVLAHPCESPILAEAGYSWLSLACAGRYVEVRTVACDSCGHLFGRRRLSAPMGCASVIGPLAALAVGVWAYTNDEGCCSSILAAYMAMMVTWLVGFFPEWVYTRVRFRERARLVDGPDVCPRCGGDRLRKLPTRRALPCPDCRRRSVRVQTVGVS